MTQKDKTWVTPLAGTAGVLMLPLIMPSVPFSLARLTAWDSVSNPLALGCTRWVDRVMRGKVMAACICDHEHEQAAD